MAGDRPGYAELEELIGHVDSDVFDIAFDIEVSFDPAAQKTGDQSVCVQFSAAGTASHFMLSLEAASSLASLLQDAAARGRASPSSSTSSRPATG